MNELAVGAVVVAISLVFVLWPLIGRRHNARSSPPSTPPGAHDARAEQLIVAARGNITTCVSCKAICAEANARFCPTCGKPFGADAG